MTGPLIRDERGSTVTEFAFVCPVFLMFLFLILDGARVMFVKQEVNGLAADVARCAAIKASGCTSIDTAKSYAVALGNTRPQIAITTANVDLALTTDTDRARCGNLAGMMRATITVPYGRGSMTLLPQSAMPSTLVSTSCFPVAG
ncbi:TadE/TadG family type IV pilus assembly protein [uncultured Sphingomonas sp.]|uniref:TadE/TadG family type IV pilus assembly protein n=1 Tax=uncultured Sphingomonas sp. TaxID=158754 RepID=UPI0025F88F4B|nr:TadE/TadG family type IV pilus assembly protein [uncultured Sphingomonas sp.]